ncbi:MAG TPA: RecQ family ATP-dependent DNA helicase [Gemmatales bacterium]|nr:RecQ family ATP-dependent DNA helicase [Gemmatales bacterium]
MSAAWAQLRELIARHWGFSQLRPLQEQALTAALAKKDLLLVMPTGGGKSLCYQAPPLVSGGTTVVVSPLIALMKDQVDALSRIGVPAIQLNSSQSLDEQRYHEEALRDGKYRLLFMAPERLVGGGGRGLLASLKCSAIAIDEAHCISHWGHDFRPEYRQLRQLRTWFPQVPIHAFTATATERVRQDILLQLGMPDALTLVGNFDRPNLTYRVLPRYEIVSQCEEVLRRHPQEAGIIYCMTRAEVRSLAEALKQRGYAATAYHAGMTPVDRRKAQDAFRADRVHVVVATIAFGMGIDRANVRFVLHANLPKSLEHYQQETGRAGRDGLEADCVLFYSGGDAIRQKQLIARSADEAGVDPSILAAALAHVDEMDRYCRAAICRHRALVEYFGQTYAPASCDACDLCLGDVTTVSDSLTLAKKILSAVARTGERFGVAHVAAVLRGERTDAIRRWQHDRLSVYGLLPRVSKAELRDWTLQLVSQGVLATEDFALPSGARGQTLKLNAASWEVMRGERTQVRLVRLARPEEKKKAGKSKQADAWIGVDRDLFEDLRQARRTWAQERELPPYMICSDATLRGLAAVRPSSLERMGDVSGMGQVRLRDLGPLFLPLIDEHCRRTGASRDVAPESPRRLSPERQQARDLFAQGVSVAEVAQRTGRAASTVNGYLEDYIADVQPASLDPWVEPAVVRQVEEAIKLLGPGRLRPLFEHLQEQVPYDLLRLVAARYRGSEEPGPFSPPR